MTKEDILSLRKSTGVYTFRNGDEILYIGKSVSLKARILSHVETAKLDPKENAIIKNSDSIEYFLTDSEFKALLLESTLIQKYHPKYNRRWQDDKSYLYIKITAYEEYPKIFSVRKENDGKSVYFGPFPSRDDVAKILKIIRKIFPFCTQQNIGKRPCFYSKIGLCRPCPNEIIHTSPRERQKLKRIYRYNIRQVIRVLEGNLNLVLKNVYSKIKKLSREEKFEEAMILRDKVLHFEKTIFQKEFADDILINYNKSQQNLSDLRKLLEREGLEAKKLKRIECYDISNLFQKEATASMVVFTQGSPDKSQYRKFRIKNQKLRSDFDMLEEVFERRFRQNWPKPDLVVVDGGTPQVLKIKKVLKKTSIPLIGIAKHPDRIVIDISSKLVTIRPSANNLGFNLIRSIRDEAHRFARKYHLLLRNKRMMI